LAIVTISRQLASGGDAIARGVAQALGLRLVDQSVINQAAVGAGVPRVAVEELGYEGRRGLVERMLSIVYEMPAIPTTLDKDAPVTPTMPGSFLSPLHRSMSVSMREYVRVVGMVIRDLAQGGDVIIVGRGGRVVLQDMPGVLHVQVIASFARREATLMARDGIERQEAMARLRASDRARADYLKRYHSADWLDPVQYDLTINTDNLPLPVAVAAVVGGCRALNEVGNNDAPSEGVESEGSR
jgi:cytidylate kinase